MVDGTDVVLTQVEGPAAVIPRQERVEDPLLRLHDVVKLVAVSRRSAAWRSA